MRKRWRAVLGTAVVALGGLTAGPGAGAQQPTIIRFGHVGFPGSVYDVVATEFAKRANQALRGRVEVRVFHSSQLGTDEAMLKAARVGGVEIFLPSTIMSTVEPRFGIFEMPYIIVGRAHMRKVAADPKVKEVLLAPLPAKGFRVLAFWENGFRHVTNNVRPIVKPEDLKGIKLRVPSGVWRVKMFRSYGANPAPMAYAEVFSALQEGVMDGQENPLTQIWSGKFQEVQRYLSLTGHVYSPCYPTISETFWKTLPADVGQTLERTAVEMGDLARREGERLDKELLDKLAIKLKVNEVDKEAFIKASASIYEDFGKEVAGATELVRHIHSLR